MRFVQLDPIRAPARAADLILRQRVAGYRAGDLDRAYPALGLAEDYLHVYGVMPESTRALLHPRRRGATAFASSASIRGWLRGSSRTSQRTGETHPRDLALLGRHRTVNGWGGNSAATTRVLEALHFRGKLRVVRRANGIKVYALAPPAASSQPAAARARAILRLLLDLYAPLPEVSFRQLARMVTESSRVRVRLRARTLRRAARRPGGRAHRRRRAAMAHARRRDAATTGAGTSAIPRAVRPGACGTGGASRCCGAGNIASRRTRLPRSASSATTRCRFCGATTSSAGPTRSVDSTATLDGRGRLRAQRSSRRAVPARARSRGGAAARVRRRTERRRCADADRRNAGAVPRVEPHLGLDVACDHVPARHGRARAVGGLPLRARERHPRGVVPRDAACRFDFRCASTRVRGIRRDAVRAELHRRVLGGALRRRPGSSRWCSRRSCS